MCTCYSNENSTSFILTKRIDSWGYHGLNCGSPPQIDIEALTPHMPAL